MLESEVYAMSERRVTQKKNRSKVLVQREFCFLFYTLYSFSVLSIADFPILFTYYFTIVFILLVTTGCFYQYFKIIFRRDNKETIISSIFIYRVRENNELALKNSSSKRYLKIYALKYDDILINMFMFCLSIILPT